MNRSLVDASVITVAQGRIDHLINLVAGLRRCEPAPTELIVVDMGSAPPIDVADVAAARGRSDMAISIVRLEVQGRLPLAASRNRGAAEAHCDRLVFLDVDCIPAPNLVGAYAEASADALCCAPVRYLDEHWRQHADPTDLEALTRVSHAHQVRPAPTCDVTDDRHELFWSLSFGVCRTVWDRLDGFDERFVGYGAEDTDLGLRARRLGIPLRWLASGTAYHQWHVTNDPPLNHLADIVDNARTFHDIWHRWPMDGWLAAFDAAGLIRWSPSGSAIELIG